MLLPVWRSSIWEVYELLWSYCSLDLTELLMSTLLGLADGDETMKGHWHLRELTLYVLNYFKET